MPVASSRCYIYFDQLAVSQRIPTIPSLDSINLLELLPELRGTFYLLDLFTMKKYTSSKQADGTGAQGKIWRKVREFSCSPQAYHFPQISNPEALQT